MHNIVFLGKYFENDLFPMRGIAQSLFREYFRVNPILNSMQVIGDCSNRETVINACNEATVIVINLDSNYEKVVFEVLRDNNFDVPIIAISTELFDTFYHKSSYEFFNRTSSYLKGKLEEYELCDKINLTISGSYEKLKLIKDGVLACPTNIYYPYLLAPSVYEDKITFMRELIKKDPVISTEGRIEDACMVYKFGNSYREVVASLCESAGLKIAYGGKWRNNDNRVKFDYDFDIIKDYYSKFKYNIAVENDYHPGWITEKLINPLIAGTIPIYYNPSDKGLWDFINKNAVVEIDDDIYYKHPEKIIDLLKVDRNGEHIFTEHSMDIFEYIINDAIDKLKSIIK